jgi:uncharacterized tellurite resistance protein B-like protein
MKMNQGISVSILYRIGFLFMAFSTVTDGELAPEELDVLAQRLKRWIAEGGAVSLIEVVEEAGRVYDMHDSDDDIRRTAYRYACLLRKTMKTGARRQVIDDLVAIAESDDVVCEGEINFMSMVMRVFGFGDPNPLLSAARA